MTQELTPGPPWDAPQLAGAQRRLHAAGVWREGLALEPFEWLESLAPSGALENVQAFRLIETDSLPPRDEGWRDWAPVLVGQDVLVGPSPEMFRRLLLTSGYFEHDSGFSDQLLLQFHRFALDLFDGYEVREQSFDRSEASLIVRGQAFRAGREGTFRTVASPDAVEFTANVSTFDA